MDSRTVPFYKNPWFVLAAIAVVAFIGFQTDGPPDSTAAPASLITAPAPAPSIDIPAPVIEPTPITNNNIIMLGDRDPVPVLDALPLPSPRRRPRREQEQSSPSDLAPSPVIQPARQSSVSPDCLPQMVAYHRKMAEVYQGVQNGTWNAN